MPAIEIKGLQELRAKLKGLASGKYLDGVLRAAQRRLLERLRDYPPVSGANRPRPAPGRWYERGYGSRWSRVRGGVGGAALRNSWATLGWPKPKDRDYC
jgi:hypothetical protein